MALTANRVLTGFELIQLLVSKEACRERDNGNLQWDVSIPTYANYMTAKDQAQWWEPTPVQVEILEEMVNESCRLSDKPSYVTLILSLLSQRKWMLNHIQLDILNGIGRLAGVIQDPTTSDGWRPDPEWSGF